MHQHCLKTVDRYKIGMANLVYNIKRTLWLDRRAAPT
jgi:hypothetical protein